MGRLTQCLEQQPSAHLEQQTATHLEQQTATESQDWDSLESAHATFSVLADRMIHSYKCTQARVRRYTVQALMWLTAWVVIGNLDSWHVPSFLQLVVYFIVML